MALRLMLDEAAGVDLDEDPALERILDRLPEHPTTPTGILLMIAVPRHDLATLFKPALDGIEDPNGEINKEMGIGDYRPAAWYRWFLNVEPRDGRALPTLSRIVTRPQRPCQTR